MPGSGNKAVEKWTRRWKLDCVGNGFTLLFGVAFHKGYVLILNFTHLALCLNHGYRMAQRECFAQTLHHLKFWEMSKCEEKHWLFILKLVVTLHLVLGDVYVVITVFLIGSLFPDILSFKSIEKIGN